MISKSMLPISTFCEIRAILKGIFTIACQELYAPELNHFYSRNDREHAVKVCSGHASSKFVKKMYDAHFHDHYIVDVPEKEIDYLMKKANFKEGTLIIGAIECRID